MNSTYWDLELNNGEVVRLTLNFGALYKLRMKDKALYDKYTAVQRKKDTQFEELDSTVLVYVAYVCANIDREQIFTYEEFLDQMPSDRQILGHCITMLLMPSKKKAGLQKHSSVQQRKAGQE